jgi:uncharacterized membrane protein
MNPGPFLAAPAIIQVHVVAALAALALGIVQIWLPKGTSMHRRLGWVWAALIATVALSSFWISRERFSLGPFSWIHGLSIFTLIALPYGILQARRHRIAAHRSAMMALFVGALVLAGLFTLAPSRILGRVLFGG